MLEFEGEPLIWRLLAALKRAGVQSVVVVLGHHGEAIQPYLKATSAAPAHPLLPTLTVVRNPRPDEGLVSLQRLGLAALTGPLDAVIVALVDQPLLQMQDLAAYEKRPAGTSVLFPLVEAEPANPVIFSIQARDEILQASEQVGCRQWREAHCSACAPWPTANRHYRVDIDTEADMTCLSHDTGRALRWPEMLPEAPSKSTLAERPSGALRALNLQGADTRTGGRPPTHFR